MAFDVGGPRHEGPKPQMNVTPLVDVVLVLLIIFMVVAPLLVKQFHLLLPPEEKPTEASPPPDDDAQIVLRLAADGTIRINREVVSRAALPERLRRMFAARVDDIVFFDAENGARYGDAVALMDVARGAGALTVAVVTAAPTR
jgi:biopolymer transport protein ExbD/biopolymer transport protein TolR